MLALYLSTKEGKCASVHACEGERERNPQSKRERERERERAPYFNIVSSRIMFPAKWSVHTWQADGNGLSWIHNPTPSGARREPLLTTPTATPRAHANLYIHVYIYTSIRAPLSLSRSFARFFWRRRGESGPPHCTHRGLTTFSLVSLRGEKREKRERGRAKTAQPLDFPSSARLNFLRPHALENFIPRNNNFHSNRISCFFALITFERADPESSELAPRVRSLSNFRNEFRAPVVYVRRNFSFLFLRRAKLWKLYVALPRDFESLDYFVLVFQIFSSSYD